MFSIDLEEAVETNDRDALHLFCKAFSLSGLLTTLPEIQETERQSLIDRLQEKKSLPAQRDSGLQEKDGGLSQDRGGAL